MPTHTPQQQFMQQVQAALQSHQLIKVQLSARRQPQSDLKAIIGTLVQLKRGLHLQLVYRHQTKDITKNLDLEQGVEVLEQALEQQFGQAQLYTVEHNLQLTTTPKGHCQLKQTAPSMQMPLSLAHDKVKERAIEAQDNIYLRQLGITNAQGQVRHEMNDKYRQINRYIELLEPHLRQLEGTHGVLHVADMGAGKGYLTFALYDYLVHKQQRQVHMTGVEYRPDLVHTCNAIAAQAGFEHLQFVQGTIQQAPLQGIDVLIALHACNTATDEAIYRGIQAQASLIVCAPCCHKQVRQQWAPTPPLDQLLKHGILQERQAEILTDGLRALIMEAHGYRTSVFEFVATEHTPKNLMLVGRRGHIDPSHRQQVLSTIAQVKLMFGLQSHYLEQLLEQAK